MEANGEPLSVCLFLRYLSVSLFVGEREAHGLSACLSLSVCETEAEGLSLSLSVSLWVRRRLMVSLSVSLVRETEADGLSVSLSVSVCETEADGLSVSLSVSLCVRRRLMVLCVSDRERHRVEAGVRGPRDPRPELCCLLQREDGLQEVRDPPARCSVT